MSISDYLFEYMSRDMYDQLLEVVFLDQKDCALKVLQNYSLKRLNQLYSTNSANESAYLSTFLLEQFFKTKIIKPSQTYCFQTF